MSKIEPPIKYEYHSWRIDAELEDMNHIKVTRYWKANKPNRSDSDWFEEIQKFKTVREALEWTGEVV